MTQGISPDFAFYLKEKKAYSNFIANTKLNRRPQQLGFFKWADTTEGYDYWNEIFSGFITFLREKYEWDKIITK